MIGKIVDITGGLLLVWLAGFLLLLNLTRKPAASFVISLLLLAAEAVILIKVMEKRDKRRKIQQGFWSAGQKFMDEILKLNPRKEFKPYIRDILNSLSGFQELTLRASRGKVNIWDDLIDMKGTFRGVPLGVRCNRPEGDKKITPEEIRSFTAALQREGLKNGLFVTSGDYGSGVIQVIREAARGGIKIMLVNRYGLINLARQAGYGVFRGDDVTSGVSLPFKERSEKNLDVFLESAFGSRKKAKSYFMYGLLLYGGYLLLKETTTFSLLYLLFAALNFLMGAGSLLFGKTLDQTDPLEGLGSEK
jgi:hypothetical protein